MLFRSEGNDFVDRYGVKGHWHATTPEVSADRVDGHPGPRAAEVAEIIRSWAGEEPRALWDRLKAEGWPSLLPVEGGRWLGPCDVGEVARWVQVNAWQPQGRYMGPDRPSKRRETDPDWVASITTSGLARATSVLTFPPLAVWQGTAETLALPDDLTGWVLYCDPPYADTSGYPHGDCPRATVLRLAREWGERGAVVAISEACPLDGEIGRAHV